MHYSAVEHFPMDLRRSIDTLLPYIILLPYYYHACLFCCSASSLRFPVSYMQREIYPRPLCSNPRTNEPSPKLTNIIRQFAAQYLSLHVTNRETQGTSRTTRKTERQA